MAETGKRIMVGDGTVRRYVDFVDSGVSLDDLPDNLVLEDPRAGRIEGRRELSRSWRVSSRWLAERDARIEWVASTVGEARAVGELVIHLTLEQMSLSLPIAVEAAEAEMPRPRRKRKKGTWADVITEPSATGPDPPPA
ncbi:MAG TPA: hypothetical protein VFT80_08675 [Actinomycetota bacterium]|nr:hypothetical protein [Actinomycetota bacterium]